MTIPNARRTLLTLALVGLTAACSSPAPPPAGEPAVPAAAATPPAAGRVFVTNEGSGDITVVDVATRAVVATIPVGKRPRGIRLSPDRTVLYVALSGSPIAPPAVAESPLSAPYNTHP